MAFPTRDPTPAEIEFALLAACRHKSVRKAAREVNACVAFEFGRRAAIDLRARSGGESHPDVTLQLLPDLAHAFWCGGLSGPVLLMTGSLRISGKPVTALRFLRVLPTISTQYNHITGNRHLADLRLPVLRGYRFEVEDFAPLSPPPVLEGQRDYDQVLAATALLAGLHPICRRIEVEALFDSLSWQRSPDISRQPVALSQAMHLASRLAASGSAERLYERARRMRSDPAWPETPPSSQARSERRPSDASDEVKVAWLGAGPRNGNEADMASAVLTGELAVEGPLRGLQAILPTIAGPDFRSLAVPLQQERGFPMSVGSELIDRALVTSLLLIGLPDPSRTVTLDRLWASHAADEVSDAAMARVLISILDLAVGNSDHAQHREELRAAAAV